MDRGPRSVLVSHVTEKTHGAGDTFGSSGILLSSGWILTHGSLLSPSFVDSSARNVRDFLESVQKDLEKDLVVVPTKVAETVKFRLQYNIEDETTRGSQQKTIEEKACTLRVIWRCPLLHKTFNDLLFSWSFDKPAKFDKSLLSIFLLLRLDGEPTISRDDALEARKVLSEFYSRHFGGRSAAAPGRGVRVEIESAPFGNAVFLESVSRGVISNVLGERGCVILTDANAVPGCEGAPLYLIHEMDSLRRICGLVIAPLSWCRGEWVDYTFAANLHACLQKILRAPDKGLSDDVSTTLLPDLLDRSVVVVKCASGWGTGVVVDVPTGTILTCSHVVREAPDSRVKVVATLQQSEARARLVYRTRDGQPYDVAVLRICHGDRLEGLRALSLAARPPKTGTAVLTAGFPFFSSGAPASCSLGVVSRLTATMLQTTCCVQSGASGGPVLDCATGEMLGLVVSNAVSASDSTALYPRFNMAVPATVLRQPVLEFLRTGDVKCLESLSSSDPKAQETWNFYLTPRSKM